MSRFVFISIWLLASFFLGAQENIIVVENKLWSNLQENCLPEGTHYTTFFHRFEGDTVIDGKTYKMVWIAEDEYHQDWFFYGAFVREENHKVYYREFLGEEGLIYDFNLQLGDTITVTNPLAPEGVLLTFVELDSLLTLDGYRKRWKLVKDEFSNPEYWIEGIGSESGVLNSGTGIFGSLCGSYYLLCHHENDQAVFLNPEYETCYYMLLDNGNDQHAEIPFELKYNRYNNQLNIDFSDNVKKQVIVTNTSGVVIFNDQSNQQNISIPFFRATAGLYIVTIIQNSRVSSRKIMVL